MSKTVDHSVNTSIADQLNKLHIRTTMTTEASELSSDPKVVSKVCEIGKPQNLMEPSSQTKRMFKKLTKRYHSWDIDECDFFLIYENGCSITFNKAFQSGSISIKKTEFSPIFKIVFVPENGKKVLIGKLHWGVFRLQERNRFSFLDFASLGAKEKVTPIINFSDIEWKSLPHPLDEKAAAKELILDLIDDWYKDISAVLFSHKPSRVFTEEEFESFTTKNFLKTTPGIVWLKKSGDLEIHAIRSKGEEISKKDADNLLSSSRHFGKALLIETDEGYKSAWKPHINIYSPTSSGKMRILASNFHLNQVGDEFNK